MATGAGSPCGACKFLRRKCLADCVFAPYFCTELGPARFAAIHKVFGASNAAKLLLQVPVPDRCEAVVSISYEAQARLRDPVYGCVSHIFALQQQVAYLQAQLMQAKAQLQHPHMIGSKESSRNAENQWTKGGYATAGFQPHDHDHQNYNHMNVHSVSPQSSLDSIELGRNDETRYDHGVQESQSCGDIHEVAVSFTRPYSKKRSSQTDLCELQELALRMMKDDHA